MAEPLKNMYNPAYFESICPVLSQTLPKFDCKQFILQIFNNSWPELELKARVKHIATCLHTFLPEDFPYAAKQLVKLSEKLREQGRREQGFAPIFIPEYVQIFGLNYPEESLNSLGEITKLVSAEFAIRPFLQSYPEKTFKYMEQWSLSDHASVRRLSSEGCRPRLPWGLGIPALKKDPALVLRILENLKDDPSEYVRKSVANNLNDIGKDHPEKILTIAKKWLGTSERTDWIIKHACRSLLKKGDSKALSLHGFDPKSKSAVKSFTLGKNKVRIGESLSFEFEFVNKELKIKPFRIEYAIDYLTSTGKRSMKVFKISENKFKPGEVVKIKRRQSFQNFTTRKHYKGKHSIAIIANGIKLIKKEFMVC